MTIALVQRRLKLMNTFMRELKEATNLAFTTNGATAYKLLKT